MLSEVEIQSRLTALFRYGEWDSKRIYLRKIAEPNPFFSANIVTILKHCRLTEATLRDQIRRFQQHVDSYRNGHQGYYWPYRNQTARMDNSRLWGRIRFLELSPDADDTCLIYLATEADGHLDRILADLSYYRIDNGIFRISPCQRRLPDTSGTFMTWFPERRKNPVQRLNSALRHRRLAGGLRYETIDIVVQANILWLLGRTHRLDLPGARETGRFIAGIVAGDWILTAPFTISHYYPYPAVILYHLARAVIWGRVRSLQPLRERLGALALACRPRTLSDRICLLSTGCLLDNRELQERHAGLLEKPEPVPAPFLVEPFMSPLLHRFPGLEPLVRHPLTHLRHTSAALQWAQLLWVVQTLNNHAGREG